MLWHSFTHDPFEKKDITDILLSRSYKSDLIRGSKHVCCLTYKGQVLAIGNNKLKTHPIMLEWGKNKDSVFLHAEMDTIVKTIRRSGAEILPHTYMYILRLTKGGRIGCSKPCPGCMKAITNFNIRDVFWSDV